MAARIAAEACVFERTRCGYQIRERAGLVVSESRPRRCDHVQDGLLARDRGYPASEESRPRPAPTSKTRLEELQLVRSRC